MEYVIENGAEFSVALEMAKENDVLKIVGRVPLSDTAVLRGHKGIAFKGEDGVIDMSVSVGGFSEAVVNGKTVWCADIPEDVAVLRPYNAFLCDGTALSRPKLPKNGFYTVAGEGCWRGGLLSEFR